MCMIPTSAASKDGTSSQNKLMSFITAIILELLYQNVLYIICRYVYYYTNSASSNPVVH
jgi:hypothetical protein